MDPLDYALRALFNGRGSSAALHVSGTTGIGTPIRVIYTLAIEDMPVGTMTVLAGTHIVHIRRSEVPAPATRDTVTIDDPRIVDAVFEIDGAPRIDVEGVTWTCILRRIL